MNKLLFLFLFLFLFSSLSFASTVSLPIVTGVSFPNFYGYLSLPQAGPYATLAKTSVSTLPNITISSSASIPYSDQFNPLKYKTVTINTGKTWSASVFTGNLGLYLWCDTLIINGNGSIDASGSDGGIPLDDLSGGIGGNGAEGGQGGGVQDGGTPGGNGTSAWVETTFFPVGGSASGNGASGRGGGGSGSQGNGSDAGGAGGGGAGILSILCNKITGASSNTLKANGGNYSLDSNSDVLGQSGGGGGVIYIGSRTYNGLISTSNVTVNGGGGGATAGNKSIQKINDDLSLTTKAFNTAF